jgi:hypothetical protein
MTFHRRLRIVVASVVASAVVVPAAQATDPSHSVQIGGELVAPAKLSSWQAHAGQSPSRRVVQIGGALVAPERLSAWQANAGKSHASASATLTPISSDSGFGWRDAGFGFGAVLGALLFIGASAYMRRARLT